MGITQNTGASSLIKPGVIDNTAARPASPYEGQVIFQKDTDQLLVWNGTAWVIPNSPAQNPQGLELLASQAIPGGATSFSFTGFTSNYYNYQVKVRIDYVSNDCDLYLRYSTAAGPDAGANYFSATLGLTDGATVVNSNQLGATFHFIGALDSAQSPQWASRSLTMEVFNPLGSTRTVMTYISWGYSQAGTGTFLSGGGCYNTTQSHTGFTMLSSNGTSVIGGTYEVYGYRK
jgi:hypothetical protein